MLQPTSAPLGPRGLEPGAALAKIQGSHQASQIPRASPAPGRNLPQVDSAKVRKPNVKYQIPSSVQFQHAYQNSAVMNQIYTIQSILEESESNVMYA